MKVKEIMTVNPKACTTTTNLAEAASFMWDYDCGILPVVADEEWSDSHRSRYLHRWRDKESESRKHFCRGNHDR